MKWILFRRCGLQTYNYNIASGPNFGRFAILGLAVLSALAAAVLANSLIDTSRIGGEKTIIQAASLETVDVLVAATNIGIGQGIAKSSLKWKKWLKESLSDGVITRQNFPDARSKLDGAMARTSFAEGEALQKNRVVSKHDGGLLSLMLPTGMRAVSIRISPETGAGGFILPNDRVDVIMTHRKASEGSTSTDFTSETVLTNARVLAIDQAIESKDSEKTSIAVGKTATLSLLPQQAEILARSAALGTLSLALRSHADSASDQPRRETSAPYVVVVHRSGKKAITEERYSFSHIAPQAPGHVSHGPAGASLSSEERL